MSNGAGKKVSRGIFETRPWLKAFLLSSGVFASGLIVGVVLTSTVLWKQAFDPFRKPPGFIVERILTDMQSQLNLSSEQSDKLKDIFAKHQKRVEEIRNIIDPKISAEFTDLQKQVEDVLTPNQATLWKNRYNEIQKRFRMPPPAGGGPMGPGGPPPRPMDMGQGPMTPPGEGMDKMAPGFDKNDDGRRPHPPMLNGQFTEPRGRMHPPDGMRQPPDEMRQPPDGMPQPPDGMQQPPDEMPQPPDGAQQPPDGAKQPPDGAQQPPDGAQQPPDGAKQPPDGMPQPPDGAQQPPDGAKQPPDGAKQPPDGTQQPPDGAQQPPDGESHPNTAQQSKTDQSPKN